MNSIEIHDRRRWAIGGILVFVGAILAIYSLWVFRYGTGSGGIPTAGLADASTLDIHPGTGIGPVSFGDDREAIIAAFGPPSMSKKANGFDVMEYPRRGFWLTWHEEKGLLDFNCFSASRARVIGGDVSYAGTTDGGIGIGSSKDDVQKAMGEPHAGTEGNTWKYKNPKITFEFDQEHVVAIGMTWDGKSRPKK